MFSICYSFCVISRKLLSLPSIRPEYDDSYLSKFCHRFVEREKTHLEMQVSTISNRSRDRLNMTVLRQPYSNSSVRHVVYCGQTTVQDMPIVRSEVEWEHWDDISIGTIFEPLRFNPTPLPHRRVVELGSQNLTLEFRSNGGR